MLCHVVSLSVQPIDTGAAFDQRSAGCPFSCLGGPLPAYQCGSCVMALCRCPSPSPALLPAWLPHCAVVACSCPKGSGTVAQSVLLSRADWGRSCGRAR